MSALSCELEPCHTGYTQDKKTKISEGTRSLVLIKFGMPALAAINLNF